MLVDDDHNDNFFHEREIKKNNSAINVIEEITGLDGLEYLKLNKQLDQELLSRVVIIMLSTSGYPEDIERAMSYCIVSEYIIKPLTKEKLEYIKKKYFS